jgi:hypothetical protein
MGSLAKKTSVVKQHVSTDATIMEGDGSNKSNMAAAPRLLKGALIICFRMHVLLSLIPMHFCYFNSIPTVMRV